MSKDHQEAAEALLGDGAIDSLIGRVGRVLAGDDLSGRGLRVGIACSRFNGGVTWRLLTGALSTLKDHGVDRGDVTVMWVPGAFELPLAALWLAKAGADAVICLGAVIRGETSHYDLVAGECASGIQRVALDSGTPVAFGVLTTDNLEQALERSGSDNKGRDVALTALRMARLVRS